MNNKPKYGGGVICSQCGKSVFKVWL